MTAPDALDARLPDARIEIMRAAAAPRATRCADCGELAAYWDSDARAYQCADHAKAPTALHLDDATSVLLLADEVFRTRGLLRYAETLLGGADRAERGAPLAQHDVDELVGALEHVAENPHWPSERRVRATRLREALENIV